MAITYKKVVFVNRFFFPDISATSQILTDIAFDLVEQGVDVEVITSRLLYDDPDRLLPKEEIVNGVKVRRISTTGFGRGALVGRAIDYLSFYFSCFFVLLFSVNRNTILVAKTDPPLISVISALIVVLKRAQLVNWLQDIFPEVAEKLGVGIFQGPMGAIVRVLRNWSLRVAKQNIVLGQNMKDYVLLQGIPPSSITIIPNWSDIDLEALEQEDNPLTRSWGLEGKFVVGYSGNMGRAHEFDTLLGAAEKLREQKDIVFLFIGSGAKRSYIEDRVSEMALSNVIFKGYQPRAELINSLRVPDIHVISLVPELEGFIVPSKFYGVAAVGRPTLFIGAKDGEISQLIEKHHAGIAVEPGQVELLTSKILNLYQARGDVKKMGSCALSAYEENYSRKKAKESWLKLIENLSR